MTLLLSDPGHDLCLPLTIDGTIEAALRSQWDRLDGAAERDRWAVQVARRIAPFLADCLDWDLKPPTRAQVSFAISIARQLDIDVPAAALRKRGAMHDFLEEHAAVFKGSSAPRGRAQRKRGL
jgi:hypothetical protein